MSIIKKIKQLNRNRLQARKNKRNQWPISGHAKSIIKEALVDLEKIDPAAYGTHHIDQFLHADIGSMVRKHQLEADFTRLVEECKGAEVIFFAPWISRGGADKVTIALFKIAEKKYGEGKVKIILTEPHPFKTKIDDSIKKNCIQFVEGKPHTSKREQIELLTRFIHFTPPKHCININSSIFWDTLIENGRIISDASTISAAAFCTELLPDGRQAGYSYSHLRHCQQYIHNIISDNTSFKKQLVSAGVLSEYGPAIWRLIRQPADFDFSMKPLPKAITPQTPNPNIESILWASRICHQKNWQAAVDLAKIHPNIKIDFWGEGEDAEKLEKAIAETPNAKYRGRFESIGNVTAQNSYDLFLYTSRMDGIPNILLEIGSLELPIISTCAGAITDLLNQDRAYLVSEHATPTEYKEALDEAIRHAETRQKKAKELAEFIRLNHTMAKAEEAFLEILK